MLPLFVKVPTMQRLRKIRSFSSRHLIEMSVIEMIYEIIYIFQLEKAAQGVAQCKVSATRVVVDTALLRGGKSRRGGHRIANISRNCGRI